MKHRAFILDVNVAISRNYFRGPGDSYFSYGRRKDRKILNLDSRELGKSILAIHQ